MRAVRGMASLVLASLVGSLLSAGSPERPPSHGLTLDGSGDPSVIAYSCSGRPAERVSVFETYGSARFRGHQDSRRPTGGNPGHTVGDHIASACSTTRYGPQRVDDWLQEATGMPASRVRRADVLRWRLLRWDPPAVETTRDALRSSCAAPGYQPPHSEDVVLIGFPALDSHRGLARVEDYGEVPPVNAPIPDPNTTMTDSAIAGAATT
jgi:hypothetical protein